MIYTIKGETPFQVLTDAFSIGPSSEGYTLQVSSDGFNYSDLFNVGPNITRMVTGVASGSYYRMKNNASEVSVNWIKDCGGSGGSGTQGPQGPAGGGGGGEGTQGPQGPMGPQGNDGRDGTDGSQGPEGAQGPEGKQGPAGSGEGGDSHVLLVSSGVPQNLQLGDVFALESGVYQIGLDKADKVTYKLSLAEMKSQEGSEVWFATSNDGEICTFMQQNSVWGFYDRGAGVFYPESGFSLWAPEDGISNANLQFIIEGDDVYAVSDASEILIYLGGAKPYVGTITQGMGAIAPIKIGEGSGAGSQGPQGPEGAQGPEGSQGPQGPAGGGSGSDEAKVLLPVAELPTYLWSEWQDEVFKIARETCTNDGDYLLHWDGGLTGVHCSSGVIDRSGYGMNQGADGRWYNNNYPTLVAWTENGKLYWNSPFIITMLDAYETGSDKEGGVELENGRVMATSGGTYQVLNNNWVPLVHSESGVMNIWKGTITEYNALGTYDNNTFYIIL